MEAFSAAIDMGADGIELDVHLTKDGHVVVAHDHRLERVSDGTGYLNDHTLDELSLLNFGKQFPKKPACRIPLLSDVFSLIKPFGITVNIELKTTERLYPELPAKLIDMAKKHGMEDKIIYSSFNHYSLQHLKQIEPSVKTGLLYESGIVDPWVYAGYVKADAIHPHYYVIAALPETVGCCHENGIKVNVWTVNNPDAIRMMLHCKADGIITDRPDIALALRKEIMGE